MENDSRKAVFEDDPLSQLPDVLLPSQFFELVGVQTFSSERRLLLAVLADAINILANNDSSKLRQRNSFNEASSWIFTHSILSPLSFDHVCDALGVDADSLRRRLSQLISERGGTLFRLRLKEASRIQCVTVNRVRRRKRPVHKGLL